MSTEGNLDILINEGLWDKEKVDENAIIEFLDAKDSCVSFYRTHSVYGIAAKAYIWYKSGKFRTCRPTRSLIFILSKQPFTKESIMESGRHVIGCECNRFVKKGKLDTKLLLETKSVEAADMTWDDDSLPTLLLDAGNFTVALQMSRVFDKGALDMLASERESWMFDRNKYIVYT